MNILKEIKWNTILSAVLFILLGILLIWKPGMAARSICLFIAWVLIAVGVVQIISYIVRTVQYSLYRNDLFSGLMLLLVGCLVMYQMDLVISLTPFILGVFITASGISKLQNAIDLKRMGFRNWLLVLLLAIVSVAAGVVMILNPFTTAKLLFQLIGISLVYSGVTDLFTTLYLSGKVRSYRREREKDIIDM